MENTITAITGASNRWRNLPVIVRRFRTQTAPPERIIVCHDYGRDRQNVVIEGVECVNLTHPLGVRAHHFAMALFADTEYTCIVDDDKPIGPKWFEHLLSEFKKKPGIYGCHGFRIRDPKDLYRGDVVETKFGPKDDVSREVDVAGQIFFFKTDWIRYFFREKPPTWAFICDLHFAHMVSKYGGVKSYVAFPKDPEAAPTYKKEELVHSEWQFAMHGNPLHNKTRREYVRWAVKNGWKLKFLKK